MESLHGRSIKPGQKIKAYVNLHQQGRFSIVDVKTGLVCGYVENCLIEDAVFYVSDTGRERVRSSGRKLVHAWVRGIYVDSNIHFNGCTEPVEYNPYYHEQFTDKHGFAVYGAPLALLKDKKIYIEETN